MSIIKKNIGVPIGVHPSVGGAYEYEKFIIKLLNELGADGGFKITLLPRDLADVGKLADGLDIELRLGHASVKRIPESKKTYKDLPPSSYLSQSVVEREKPEIGLVGTDLDLNRHLKNMGIDALCCLSPGLTGPLSGLPYVAPIWDLMHRHFDYPEVTINHEQLYRDLININMIAKAKCIFAESNAGKDDIIRHYGGFVSTEKLKVVDILPCDYLESSSSVACSLRNEITELGKKRFFLYPAQYWAHKCHKTLILAASLLKQQGISDFRLVFTGSYGDRHRAANYLSLVKLVEEHNVSDLVQFLGFVEKQELDFLYRNALCLLMPSAFGPTNLPPLEALMRGCPVAVSSAYGMSQFLPFGVPLIDSNQVESWCDEMKLFLNDYQYRAAVYLEQSKNLHTRSLKNAVRQFSDVLKMLTAD